MRSIIWKEIRENLKWAVLWMVGMGLAMTYALSQQGAYYNYREGISICSDVFLLITTVGCAAGAALLGLLQVVVENKKDQWAFLVHRPVTRTTIWMGKVIAGLMLYLSATGIPFLLATWWVSSPGNVAAPFDWRMILPGVADILCGMVFYFAGMLTGLRQTRWYGSRAMGIAAAILCAMFTVNVGEFWQAVIAIILFGGVLAVAAWGSFLTAGAYRPQPILAKISLGLSLLVGISVTVVFLGAMAVAITVVRFPTLSTRYHIDKEGNILRVRTDYLTIESVTDLDGNPVEKYADEKYRVRDTFNREVLWPVSIRHGVAYRVPPYRRSSRFFTLLNHRGDPAWHYVLSERRISGYSLRAKRLIGSIGPEGFSPPSAQASSRFDGRLTGYRSYREQLYAFSKAVYEIDLTEKKIKLIFSAQEGQEIYGAATLRGGQDGPTFVAVAAGDRLHVLSEEGEAVFATDFARNPQQYPNVSVVMLAKGSRFFVWQTPSWRMPYVEGVRLPSIIVEYDASGNEMARHELPPISREQTASWFERATAVVMPVSVLAVLSAYALVGPWFVSSGTDNFFVHLDNHGINLITYCLLVFSTAVVCTVVSLMICGRYAFRKRRLYCWMIVVFLVGPWGLLLLWALLDWPAFEQCSACGRKRVVTDDQCQHCQAAFPAPVLDGTEIFET